MRHRGYDSFTPDNFESFDIKNCLICGSPLVVTKSKVRGPTGFAEAMSRSGGHVHDVVECKFSEEAWHEQAFQIMEKIDECPSKTIRDLMQAELDEIKKTRVPTLLDLKEDIWN